MGAAEVQTALADILGGRPMRLAAHDANAVPSASPAADSDVSNYTMQLHQGEPNHATSSSKTRTIVALSLVLAVGVIVMIVAFLR
jgi:hypothetical protein